MNDFSLSFEVFPPKAADGIAVLYPAFAALSAYDPEFISVTYSAGGSARGQTAEVCKHIKSRYGVEIVAHLTCAGNTKSDIADFLSRLKDDGIKKVLALRGDKIHSESGDFLYATELISQIASMGGFEIFAACYPEGHKESKNFNEDIEVMKIKNDLGATHFLSQLFFDNSDFLSMRDLAAKRGVNAIVSAGLMPVTNAKQIVKMVQLSGAKIPQNLAKMISKYENDPTALFEAGLDYTATQVLDLLKNGADGIHLYTMNNPLVAGGVIARIRHPMPFDYVNEQ